MASDAQPTVTKHCQTIEEGQAKVLLTSDHVFYNPVQEFNRDLSIAVLRTFIGDYQNKTVKKQKKTNTAQVDSLTISEDNQLVKGDENKNSELNLNKNDFSILEALSATGLRSIRYAKEIPGVSRIIANDISAQAVESIESNIEYNGVKHIVETSHDDASMIMYKNRRHSDRFSAVDLDPYGCPSIFLDAAVQCVQDGGLLLVTATDMAVLAGNSPETCYSKYGSISLRSKYCHEQALRILLQCIESHANRYGRYIVPLLSVSADFYIRVFVKIITGPVHCKKTTSKLSMIYQCVGCETFTLQPLGTFKPNPSPNDPSRMKATLPHAPPLTPNCLHCNQKIHMGGPIWTGPLHDTAFVEKILVLIQNESEKFSTSKRISGVLGMIREELIDVPLYFSMDKLCSRLHLETMPMLVMRSAILNGGFRVSFSHACKTSIKTDAPPTFLWDVMRFWEKRHPVKKERLIDDSVAGFVLSQELSNDIDLSERKDANPVSRREGFCRFQDNPTPNWGPGTRSSARTIEDKSKKNQNKKNDFISTKDLKVLKRERSLDTSPDQRKHSKMAVDT